MKEAERESKHTFQGEMHTAENMLHLFYLLVDLLLQYLWAHLEGSGQLLARCVGITPGSVQRMSSAEYCLGVSSLQGKCHKVHLSSTKIHFYKLKNKYLGQEV